MRPSLFEIFGEPVASFFVFVVLGFAAAFIVLWRWAKKYNLDKDAIIDILLYAIVFGVAGARIMHVLADGYLTEYVNLCIHPERVIWHIAETQCDPKTNRWDAAAGGCRPLSRDCFAWAAFWNGGLTLYGGFALAFFACFRLAKKEGLPVAPATDTVAIGIPLAVAFGRIGCFLSGCCYGKPTGVSWAVSFPAGSPASDGQYRAGMLSSPFVPSLPVHPTQIYEAFGALCIALLAGYVIAPRKRFHGQVAVFSMIAYAVMRFFLEYLRDDDRGGISVFSTSQWVGIVAIVIALVISRLASKNALYPITMNVPKKPPKTSTPKESATP